MPTACETVAAIFLPPLAVSYARGCGIDVVLNIILWGLGAIPAIIHAFYVLNKRDKAAGVKKVHKVKRAEI